MPLKAAQSNEGKWNKIDSWKREIRWKSQKILKVAKISAGLISRTRIERKAVCEHPPKIFQGLETQRWEDTAFLERIIFRVLRAKWSGSKWCKEDL